MSIFNMRMRNAGPGDFKSRFKTYLTVGLVGAGLVTASVLSCDYVSKKVPRWLMNIDESIKEMNSYTGF